MYTTQISYPAIAKVWPPVSLEGMSKQEHVPSSLSLPAPQIPLCGPSLIPP